METVDTVICRAMSEIRTNQNAQMKPKFIIVKDFLDDSGVSYVFFWERMKTLEDQGVIISKPTKCVKILVKILARTN